MEGGPTRDATGIRRAAALRYVKPRKYEFVATNACLSGQPQIFYGPALYEESTGTDIFPRSVSPEGEKYEAAEAGRYGRLLENSM